MLATGTKAAVRVKNILYLTDFSEPSEAALPFATTLGRGYGAKVDALHVLVPAPYTYTTPGLTTLAIEAEEENAQAEMQKVESRLAGLEHRTLVERGIEVWPSVQRAVDDDDVKSAVCEPRGIAPCKPRELLSGTSTDEHKRVYQDLKSFLGSLLLPYGFI